MVELFNTGAYLVNGKDICADYVQAIKEFESKTGRKLLSKEEAKKIQLHTQFCKIIISQEIAKT